MKISYQIRLLPSLLVFLTAILIGAVVYFGYQNLARQQQQQYLEHLVELTATAMQGDVNTLKKELFLLGQVPLYNGLRDEQPTARIPELQELFRKIAESHAAIEQLRLLDLETGQELIRVDQRERQVRVLEDAELQNKQSRDYFQQARQMALGDLYVSAINLNREFGAIEQPYRPMVRLAQQVSDDSGQAIGLLVMNVNFDELFQSSLELQDQTYSVFVTNAEGDYLIHPDPDREFGFELGRRFRLQEDFPEVDLQDIKLSETASEMSFQSLARGRQPMVVGGINPWGNTSGSDLILAIAANQDLLGSGYSNVLRNAMILTCVLVLLASVIGYFLASYLTQPLQQLTLTSQRLKQGELEVEFPVERDDEIGTLARAFRKMIEKVHQQEAQLRDTNARLKTANADLEHFTHLAAHDLREPLRKQRNLLDLLELELEPLEGETGQLLQLANQCAARMDVMVHDFRRLTRVGEVESVRERLDLPKIIATCLDDYADRLQSRRIRCETEPLPDGIQGYPSLVQLLYQNLIANALTHVSQDGFELKFTAKSTDQGWILGVFNTGASIPEADLSQVFKMFRTGDGTPSPGTGVGLSLCKRIVDKHAGTIFAESGADFVHFQFLLETA